MTIVRNERTSLTTGTSSLTLEFQTPGKLKACEGSLKNLPFVRTNIFLQTKSKEACGLNENQVFTEPAGAVHIKGLDLPFNAGDKLAFQAYDAGGTVRMTLSAIVEWTG